MHPNAPARVRSTTRTRPYCCPQDVERFVQCHEDHPIGKFFNACGPLEAAMNACFREEKKLRLKLNRENPPKPWFPMPAELLRTAQPAGGTAAAKASDPAASAAPTTPAST